jgi:hypothetical protein
MKVTECYATILLATGVLVGQAQSATPAGSPSLVLPVGGMSYNDYPYSYHSSTLQEGYARGIADVIRAKGDYNLSTSAAAVNFSQARQQEIENQRKWEQAYFDLHNLNRQMFESEQKRRRGSPEDWIRYAQAGKPKRLSASELDTVTGEIRWPMLLTAREYSSQRVELEKAFSDRAYHGVLGAETFLMVLQLTDDLMASLKQQIRNLPADKYIAAKRFLESLAFEAGQPAG